MEIYPRITQCICVEANSIATIYKVHIYRHPPKIIA